MKEGRELWDDIEVQARHKMELNFDWQLTYIDFDQKFRDTVEIRMSNKQTYEQRELVMNYER